MSNASKHTESPREIVWPTVSQILCQLGLIILIVAIWTAIFLGYLAWNHEAEPETVAQNDNQTSTDTAPEPTDTPTTIPSPTTSPVTDTALAANEPITTETQPLSTETPTPLPIPTETATPSSSNANVAVSFQVDVLPILERRCVKCHGSERAEEDLFMETYEQVMAGSWGGPVVEPGDAEGSYMMELIYAGEMPKNDPRLLPNEIRTLETWINDGALDN